MACQNCPALQTQSFNRSAGGARRNQRSKSASIAKSTSIAKSASIAKSTSIARSASIAKSTSLAKPASIAKSASIARSASIPKSASIAASASSSRGRGGREDIRVVINGAASAVGMAAIAAVTRARGMAVAGAVDSFRVGEDAGELAGLDEPLEVPIINDLVLVLSSLSQSTTSGVMVEFSSNSKTINDNVRQATAFGMKSVVCGSPAVDPDVVAGLVSFCEKASTGCVICPTLSIGRILLQQAAIAAAFHYASLQIIESSSPDASASFSSSSIAAAAAAPSPEAVSLSMSVSELGRRFNQNLDGDDGDDGGDGEGSSNTVSASAMAKGAVVGDGVRVHTLPMPGPGLSSMDVRFSGPGEMLTLKHEIGSVSALMPGLLVAIRRVVRVKTLIYGLEKLL